MCPGTVYWRDWHAERDARLAAEYGAHAIYYDIALHNMLLQCLAEGHDHLPGSGEPLTALFERMYRDTSLTMSEAAGRYVPMGAEVMTETSIALFDFSQHRADGGPYASFEPVPFRDWILDGRAARIPLLTYVFGERAPLRMDGWAKLSREAGDLWYWVAATVLLEGGLLEVNGEFSPLEDVGGWTEDVTESYARIVPRGFGLDPDKLAFLGQVARTRVGPANPWLAHGRMLPPPRVEASTIEPAWYAYNAGQDHSMYDTRGTMRVPSVLARAWAARRPRRLAGGPTSRPPQVARVDGIEVQLPPARSFSSSRDRSHLKEPSSVDRFETLVGSRCPACPCCATARHEEPRAGTRTGGNDDRLHIARARRASTRTSRVPGSSATLGHHRV